MIKTQNNLTSQAYELISQKIITSAYQPGQKISEKKIEEDINIGRTPVRESLLLLRQEGLIEVIPQSGTYVSKIDLKSVLDARLIRTSIEQQIMQQAAESDLTESEKYGLRLNLVNEKEAMDEQNFDRFLRLDDEFHHQFYFITDHSQIWEWIKMVNIQFDRYRFLSLSLKEHSWKNLIDDHELILKSVINKNLSYVENATKKHLHLALEEQKAVVKKFPDYFVEESVE